MRLPFLDDDSDSFPDVSNALAEPNGLLAAGGNLNSKRLLNAYAHGIFPWYSEFLEDGSPSPILWWCPQPRCVLLIDNLKISRSLAKVIRNGGFQVSCNQAFQETIFGCSTERINYKDTFNTGEKAGTWINPAIQKAYYDLHKLGAAHSIECWFNDELVGGLYGIAIGKMFYGESMFSRKSNASKVAFVYLCSLLKAQGAQLIDCQIANPHLMSLGATEISLEIFQQFLDSECKKEPLVFPCSSQNKKTSAREACAGLLT